jgi:hypothetical protein
MMISPYYFGPPVLIDPVYTNIFQENYLSNLKSNISVLKRVPKAARPLVSNELTNVINDVVEKILM